MAKKPISRHYDYGCTFRWIQGESHIAVKRGYVCEGKAFIVVKAPRNFQIQDRPGDDPHDDKHTWIASIPANPDYWNDDRHFVGVINTWAQNNPRMVDLQARTGRR